MATEVSATWRYGSGGVAAGSPANVDHDAEHAAIRRTLLEVFADHDSPSVQTSMWLIGRAILERHAAVDEIRMTMPNLHHWRVDLTPFGMEDRGEVFVATREPHGRIEATVRRSDAR
jgi:urate oxidase